MGTDNSEWQIKQPFHNYAGMSCTRSLQKSRMVTGSFIPGDCMAVHCEPPKAPGTSPLQQHSVNKYWIRVSHHTGCCTFCIQYLLALNTAWLFSSLLLILSIIFRDCLTAFASMTERILLKKKSKALLIKSLIFSVLKGIWLFKKIIY